MCRQLSASSRPCSFHTSCLAGLLPAYQSSTDSPTLCQSHAHANSSRQLGSSQATGVILTSRSTEERTNCFSKSNQLADRPELCHSSSEASTDFISKESTSLLKLFIKDHYIFFPGISWLPVDRVMRPKWRESERVKKSAGLQWVWYAWDV